MTLSTKNVKLYKLSPALLFTSFGEWTRFKIKSKPN